MEVSFQTPRLVVDEFTEGDAAVFVQLASETDVALHWAEETVTKETALAFLRQALSRRREKERSIYELAVRRKPQTILVGECELGFFPGEREAELGFFVGRKYRDHGYGTEAVRGLVAFGFHELGLSRIYGYCDVANKAGAAVMQKSGLRNMGIERLHNPRLGDWHDGILFEVLASEYGRMERP